MYQDNKATCAVHLKNQFNNIFLRDFPNCNAYANRLKHIADQLANVGAKVADDRLVLRLVGGLTESYSTFVTVIQNMTPFTSFAKAKSMLLLDETNKKNLTSQESSNESALITSSASNNFSSPLLRIPSSTTTPATTTIAATPTGATATPTVAGILTAVAVNVA